jgi:TRAP-type C4-dicarboxylate transport system permease small subunit
MKLRGLPSEPKKAFNIVLTILSGAVCLFLLWVGYVKVLNFIGCRVGVGEEANGFEWLYLLVFVGLLWVGWRLLKLLLKKLGGE